MKGAGMGMSYNQGPYDDKKIIICLQTKKVEWFSNFSERQNHPKSLLEQRLFESTSRALHSVG